VVINESITADKRIIQDAIASALKDHIASNADFNAEQKQATARVWRRLALYLVAHMKAGYSDAMARLL